MYNHLIDNAICWHDDFPVELDFAFNITTAPTGFQQARDGTGTVMPYLCNLSNGQIIKVGNSVTLSLALPLTKGRIVSLLYKFTILET